MAGSSRVPIFPWPVLPEAGTVAVEELGNRRQRDAPRSATAGITARAKAPAATARSG